jgi:dolichol kinase
VTGPLKAAWALTAFVVVAGLVLWLVTGKAVFAVFLVLGVLTGLGAWFTGRSTGRPTPTQDAPREEAP